MPHARNEIALANLPPEITDVLYRIFDSVWDSASTKSEAVAHAIAEALCTLARAGQSSSERLYIYAAYKAKFVV
jgi:hypothetical protein